jgi:hypothetical protein
MANVTTNVHRVVKVTMQHNIFDSFRSLTIVLDLSDGDRVSIDAFSDERLQVETLPDMIVSKMVSE